MPTNVTPMTVKNNSELTVRDRLSRLDYRGACSLLGRRGSALLRAGGAYDIDIAEAVALDDERLLLRFADASGRRIPDV